MNREEIKKVVAILATAYPRHYTNMSREGLRDQINLYEGMFGEYPAEVVVTALRNYIRVNEYPPTIAGLQKQIDLIVPPKDEAVQLWNELARACRRGSVMTEAEFDRLPDPIKAWCGDLAQIRELSQMDMATFNSVTRGQFIKTIPTIIERKKVSDALPEPVKAMLGKLSFNQIETQESKH